MKLPPGYVPGHGTHKPTAKGGFGERLLKQFGWKEGKGLGAKEDGMAEALKVKQKKDNTGVGANNSALWGDKWWEDAFAQSIASVNDIHEATLKADSSSDSDSSDSEDSTADVPSDMHADGTRSTATAAELALAKELAKDPWGRFGGRRGKIARLRAQEATCASPQPAVKAAAVATQQTPPATDAVACIGKKGKRRKRAAESMADAAASDAATPNDAAPKAKRKKAAAKADAAEASAAAAVAATSKPLVVRIPAAVLAAEAQMAAALAAFKPTPAAGWWGAKRFISVGALGSTLETLKPADTERKAFTEDTQEAAYMALHNAKTSGKKGLGKVAGSGIVGGAKWEGTKVSFDDDEQPAAVAAAIPVAASVSAEELESAQTVYESPAEDGPSSPAAPAAAKSFPYKKVIRSLLQQAEGQTLTFKQLGKQIRQQWATKSAKYGPAPESAELKAALPAKLERMKGIVLEGKCISIAA